MTDVDTRRIAVPGVLIEGHEYSGKSTLARHVVQALRQDGFPVLSAHGCMTDDPAVRLLLGEVLSMFAGVDPGRYREPAVWRRFNALRSAQIMADARLAESRLDQARERGELVVLDRYWLAQHAFNRFFTPGEEYLSQAWVDRAAPDFTVQVYLRCEPETRRRRDTERPLSPKHPLNTFMRSNLDGVDALDEVTAELIDGDSRWLVLWSDREEPHSLAGRVLALLHERLGVSPPDDSEPRSHGAC